MTPQPATERRDPDVVWKKVLMWGLVVLIAVPSAVFGAAFAIGPAICEVDCTDPPQVVQAFAAFAFLLGFLGSCWGIPAFVLHLFMALFTRPIEPEDQPPAPPTPRSDDRDTETDVCR